VPNHYSLDPQLGIWVDNQRNVFKKGRMDFERKAKLDEIGFEMSVKDKTNEAKWNLQFKKLQDYYGKHGHCELFLAVDRFILILNAPTNTTPVSLLALQVMFQQGTWKSHQWEIGSAGSEPTSKKVEWILNEKRNWTRLVLNSLSWTRRTRKMV
jgi:hypothetical protein